MNEKTKQILRYVACGLGGVALGIGLLGGLAMCASSGKSAKAESVNTILTKKNAVITTNEGGYNGYRFTLTPNWPSDVGTANGHIYSVDLSTYTLTSYATFTETVTGQSSLVWLLNNKYEEYPSSEANEVRFIAVWSKITYGGNTSSAFYFSFIPNTNSQSLYPQTAFVTHFDYYPLIPISLDTVSRYSDRIYSSSSFFTINFEKNNCLFVASGAETPIFNELAFQDAISYYKSQGYQDGYEDGYSNGYAEGESVGYSSGYAEGESVGYSSGYADGFRTGYMNTYYAFTSLTANLNKVWNMAEIPWHRNTDILVTQDNFDDFPFFDIAHLQVGIYINWAYLALFRDTVTLTPYYVYAQRYTTSQNDGYNVCINIAPASQDTIQEDGNIGGTTGPYLLQEDSLFQLSHTTVWTAPNRCRLIGFMEDTEDIYTNWFDDGYLIPQGIEVDGNAYEEGYRQGQHDATNDTDIQNVFSLLTPAFTAVGGFFNLKVFGFLPLYWFFLAPLFVALITLLLRMVKH